MEIMVKSWRRRVEYFDISGLESRYYTAEQLVSETYGKIPVFPYQTVSKVL
jgi:hypothetical protein